MSSQLDKLNKAQKQAVTHTSGPLLIVAGAGTGKTTVLVNRLAYLATNKKVPAENILLLTFTEKAAGEMEERADRALPYGYTDLWISTFHGFGERVLREFSLDIGLGSNFRLLSETDQWMLIKKNLDRFQLDYYRPLGNPTKFISELIHHFSRLKDENILSSEYLKYAEELEADKDSKLSSKQERKYSTAEGEALEVSRIRELAEAYHTYNQLLLENDCLDFGDLIGYTIKLFKERPNILEFYRQKFKYIMVDEFQDTNWAQYELVKLLAAPNNNLVVVGDDDQAIYKFRGASLSNILQFKDDYPEAKEIVLTDNYRSRSEILAKSYDFIQNNNPQRLEVKLGISKRLKAVGLNEADNHTSAVQYFNFDTRDDEVSFVVQKIKSLHKTGQAKGLNWSDFAILVRANDTAEAYVKELSRCLVPNQFMSWRGLYYKPLILDCLAYFRLLDNYHESSALFRVLNREEFKVPHADLININKMAARKVWSLYEALEKAATIPGLSPNSLANISKLLQLIAKHSRLAAEAKPTKIFLNFVYDSGLISGLDRDRDTEQFSYLNQFYQKIKKMEESEPDLRLKDFLSAMNLELEAGETGALKLDFNDSDTVKVMTVHGAKGLEFSYVFLVNLVDKKFPTIVRGEKIPIPDHLVREKIVASDERAAVHLAEERRLFYVAMTRAKTGLYLTSAKDYGGVREKKPSKFITEMGIESASLEGAILSEKNELLRDLHNINEQSLDIRQEKPITESYPLPEKFSFSQLAAYSTCPLQYKFAFILKVPVPSDKASLIFGRVLHNTLYNFLLPLLDERRQANLFSGLSEENEENDFFTQKRLLDLYQEFWQPDGYASKGQRAEYQTKGRVALRSFWQSFQEEKRPNVMFLEKKFSFRIGSDIIKGTIDRVDKLSDGTLEIIDYKTGKEKTTLQFSDKRQLILYQLFLEEFLNVKVSKLSFYYLENNKKKSFTATAKDFTKLKLEMAEQIAAIKSGQFDPQPTTMCKYCDFRDICEFRQV